MCPLSSLTWVTTSVSKVNFWKEEFLCECWKCHVHSITYLYGILKNFQHKINIISYWPFFVGFIVDVGGNWFVPIGVWVVARCMFLGKLRVALIWINQIIIVMITDMHFILFLEPLTYHQKFLLQYMYLSIPADMQRYWSLLMKW